MRTGFWEVIAAFGVWQFGEKKPIKFGSETQIQNERKVKKSGCGLPTHRERAREGEKHRQKSNTV
jgi:hypothetical protein